MSTSKFHKSFFAIIFLISLDKVISSLRCVWLNCKIPINSYLFVHVAINCSPSLKHREYILRIPNFYHKGFLIGLPIFFCKLILRRAQPKNAKYALYYLLLLINLAIIFWLRFIQPFFGCGRI